MNNPGTSLFQGPDININNSQNNEEEEDIEDQKRRKEELQNLLTAALDDYNYEESTINSSNNVSLISHDGIQQNYRDAVEPNEQLKILYDVRLRELTKLKEEFVRYKDEKSREVDMLKNKLILSEADIGQLKVSLKNAESLLVEKAGSIKDLTDALNDKNAQIKNHEKTIEKFQIEICTYESTINELQLKLQADNNPFCMGAKQFNSEELKKAHQDQVLRLESLLEEQTKAAKIFEKEKLTLQEELRSLIELRNEVENDDKNTIEALSRSLYSAQQQCKELIEVVEILTIENKHFRERCNEINTQTLQEEHLVLEKSLDSNTLLGHVEKLKRMLLDKSVQLDTLNAKLKHYEEDIKELLEYRELKSDIYKKDFQQCENRDHTKSLLLMQNDLQNYRRTIEDKNQQILMLNSTNRDLQVKIEEMLMQTRNDIQNLSHKYSLPQLEQMTEELNKAEEKVRELQDKLERSEEQRLSLVQKLQKNDKDSNHDINNEYETQILNLKKEKSNYENQLIKLQKDFEICTAEIRSLKQFTEDLINENARLKLDAKDALLKLEKNESEPVSVQENTTIKKDYEQLKEQLNQVMMHLQKTKNEKDCPEIVKNLKLDMEEFLNSLQSDSRLLFEKKIKYWNKQLDQVKNLSNTDDDKVSKQQYKETLQNLHEAKKRIKKLEETMEDLGNAKTIAEGEKCTYQFEVKDCETQLEHAQKSIKHLQSKLVILTKTVQDKDEQINKLTQAQTHHGLDQLKEELNCKSNALKFCEEDKRELSELLQKNKQQSEESKKEVLLLQKEISDMSDKIVRRNLERELKEAENQLEENRVSEANVLENEQFKKCLQTELLKSELKLREDMQQEYLRKLSEIEKKYQNAYASSNDLYNEQVQKMNSQELRYREHLANVLAECAKKIGEFESDKQNLNKQISSLRAEYTEYKKNVIANEDKHKILLKKMQTDAENTVEEWKNWSKNFVSNFLKIETTAKKSRDGILLGMKNADTEVAALERSCNEKIKKYLKNDRLF